MNRAYKLNEIHVKGYKSIKDQKISLSKLNILIGQNGAGKSNFISIFKFLRNIIEGRLKNVSQSAGAESLLYYGSKETSRIFINLDFDPNYYEILLQPSINSDTLFVEKEYCGYWGDKSYPEPYWEYTTNSEEESQLPKKIKSSKIANYVYWILRDWRVYHFHDTSESAGVKKYASMADNKFLFEDASNLAPFLYLMKETQEEYYERLVKTIKLVIPFFKGFVLEPNPFNEEIIRLEWQDIHSEKIFTANDFSDGSLRFICMATLLLQKNLPRIVLLDEPELGLHPTAISILAGLLRKATNRAQVIVSTQSVNLVNEFEPEDIIVVEHKEAETIFNRLEFEKLEDWLENYSLGDLWDKNVIGGKP